MKLNFELTGKDYLAYTLYCQATDYAVKRSKIISLAVPPLMIGNLVYTHWDDGFTSYKLYDLAVFILALLILSRVVFYKWLLWQKVKHALQSDPEHYPAGRQELLLGKTALTVITTGSRAEMGWSTFTGMKEDKEHLFLFMNKTRAVIIPKNIFLLPQELYDVQTFIEEKLTYNNRNHEQGYFPETGAGQHDPADTGGHIARMG